MPVQTVDKMNLVTVLTEMSCQIEQACRLHPKIERRKIINPGIDEKKQIGDDETDSADREPLSVSPQIPTDRAERLPSLLFGVSVAVHSFLYGGRYGAFPVDDRGSNRHKYRKYAMPTQT